MKRTVPILVLGALFLLGAGSSRASDDPPPDTEGTGVTPGVVASVIPLDRDDSIGQTQPAIETHPLAFPGGVQTIPDRDSYWDGALKGFLVGGIPSALLTGLVFSGLDDDPDRTNPGQNHAALEGMAYGLGVGGVAGAVLGAMIDAATGGPPLHSAGARPFEGHRRFTIGPYSGFANATDRDNSRVWRPFFGARLGYESRSRLIYEFYMADSRERDGEKIFFWAANALVPVSLGDALQVYYSSGLGMMRVETPSQWSDGTVTENFADISLGSGLRWRLPGIDAARIRLEYRWHPIPDRYHEISLGFALAVF